MQTSAATEDECRHARKPRLSLRFLAPSKSATSPSSRFGLNGALIVWVEPSVQTMLQELKHVGPARAGCLTAEIAEDVEVLSLPEVTLDTHG